MQSQVGLRKHHCKKRWWRWWNSSWALSNPKKWFFESAKLNIPAYLENSAVVTGLEKISFIPISKKGNAKEFSKYHTIALISYASDAPNSPSQASIVRDESQDVWAGFRKGRGTRDQIATSVGSLKKQECSRKTSISVLLTRTKPLTVWTTANSGKFWKGWEYQTTWLSTWEICI